MFMRKTGAAIAAALLTSAVGASAAQAAGETDIACTGGQVVITAAAGITNGIKVTSVAANKYKISDVGAGASLSYTVGGCLAGIEDYTSTQGTITVSGTITGVKISSGDLGDVVNTTALTGVRALIYGQDGNDLIYGSNQGDTINGGAGTDTIYGYAGNDVITGWTGSDTIKAGDGDDTIYEADGYADNIDGGNGTDNATADPADTIVNLESVTY